MYRRENKSIPEIYQKVEVIFYEHNDLLVEFNHFLPHIQYPPQDRNSTRHEDDRGSPMTTTRPMHAREKPAVSYALGDQFADHNTSEQLNHVEKVTNEREDVDKSEWEHTDNVVHKQKSANQDESGADRFQQGMLDPESVFLEKVKEGIQDPENCKKIYDCICSYKSKFVAAAQFKNLVTCLLRAHPDLMEACEDYITYIEKNGSLRRNKLVTRSSKMDGNGIEHDRVERHRNRDRDKGESNMHDRGLTYDTKDAMGQKVSSYAGRDKFTMKPIQELDLSNCESCTPSYRLLPEHFPIPPASFRTKIGAKVLNDRWVSVTSGSDDYTFKHVHKNQYEESLFRCEDDRFELDMLLEYVNTTAKRFEELLNTLNSHAHMDASAFCIEHYLTGLNVRCIEQIYGDHGMDAVDALKMNAPRSLPVILRRLKQKQVEWAQCRADFNNVWAEIYAKNHHKSLDHRSYYFKQQDTKNLSARALIAKIKETSEKNQNEDEMVPSICAGEICTPEQCDEVMRIWTNFLEPLHGIPSLPRGAEDKQGNGTSWFSRQVGSLEEGDSCTAGEKSTDEENASTTQKGLDSVNSACGLEVNCTEESQLEVFGAQSCHNKSEAPSNFEGEKGELSSENLEDKKLGTKKEETPCGSMSVGGGDTCIVAEDNTDADDAEENAHGSLDMENASEKGQCFRK